MSEICKTPCGECPFTNGTEASKYEPTKRLMRHCVKTDIPFMCHKTMKEIKGEILGYQITDRIPTHICAGWANAKSYE